LSKHFYRKNNDSVPDSFESFRLLDQAPEPFQTDSAEPLRCTLLFTGEIIEGTSDTHGESDIILIFEAIQEYFLLWSTEVTKKDR